MNKKQAEAILQILEKERFAEWYNEGGRFDNYIRVEYPKGHPDHITRDMILEDVIRLFNSAAV
jgi:hypothetical protein